MNMNQWLLEEYASHGGVQRIYRFPNGFGASVVRHHYSYGSDRGLWELAVALWSEDDWEITYDTPITSDVIGHLTDAEVQETLVKIKALP